MARALAVLSGTFEGKAERGLSESDAETWHKGMTQYPEKNPVFNADISRD